MKKSFFLQSFLIMICMLLFSCSKEKVLMQPVVDNTAPNGNSADRLMRGGSVTGYILPERASVKISVYNRLFTSADYYYTRDGHFRFDGLPEGLYTVRIQNTETLSIVEVPVVKVKRGMITDIGVIIIQ